MYVGGDIMKIDEFDFPDALYYTEHHFWVRDDGDVLTLGVTDYAQQLAGEFIYVELPDEDTKVKKGKPFASLESGKWVGRIYGPVNGIVTEANEELDDDATIMNSSPYGEGWICKIKPDNKEELNDLFRVNNPDFQAWIKEEITKNVKKE